MPLQAAGVFAFPRVRRSSFASLSICASSSGQSETHSHRLRLEAQTAVPAWSFAVDLGRSAASWVPLTGRTQRSTPSRGGSRNSNPSLGLASGDSETCLPSRICWIVLAQGGAACAGARYDLRGNGRGGGGRAQGWLGNRSSGGAWISPSVRRQRRLLW